MPRCVRVGVGGWVGGGGYSDIFMAHFSGGQNYEFQYLLGLQGV